MDEPRARVEMVGGQPVLIDPDGCAVARAVGKHNCKATFEANADRVAHFKRRAEILGWEGTHPPTVIVLLAVDDEAGRALADALMPGHDWQQYRDRGTVPFARGLAGRGGGSRRSSTGTTRRPPRSCAARGWPWSWSITASRKCSTPEGREGRAVAWPGKTRKRKGATS